MATVTQTPPPGHAPGESASRKIYYPDSDGKPMADNTLQWEWITTIKTGLEAQFRDRPDVFIAGDLLWYPFEGKPDICVAPDVMVVFGRPKGYRGSYRQWQEEGIAPQVVFEVLSPGNTVSEMLRKFQFYERQAVFEYYVYDPGNPLDEVQVRALSGWRREDVSQPLKEIEQMDGWHSPLLDITFHFNPLEDLRLLHPNGRVFDSYVESNERADQAEQRAEQLARQIVEERQRAEQERQRDAQRIEQMMARLRAAGLDLENLDGTPPQ